ncbi:MAG: TPM domain-containing protein [Lachnospiraceae bacterium]|nr:TPM domain-containing protein [Lachnospiraceae bacterium]
MLLLVCNAPLMAAAADTEGAGSYYIDDELGLFEGEDMTGLYAVMEELCGYGNVLLLTAELKAGETDSYCDREYVERFGYTEGVVFLIDMGDRMLWFKGMEDTDKVITDSVCNTIMDNVYTYASEGDYVKVSEKAFEQALTVLKGNRIAQPLKYISNFFFAVTIAFIICFQILRKSVKTEETNPLDVFGHIVSSVTAAGIAKKLIDTKKRYIPPSSSSSSSSSGGSSYRSSGGGSRSSGGSSHHSSGGGHRF